METKCTKNKLELVKRSLKFDYYFAIDSMGLSVGLAMFWSEDVEL